MQSLTRYVIDFTESHGDGHDVPTAGSKLMAFVVVQEWRADAAESTAVCEAERFVQKGLLPAVLFLLRLGQSSLVQHVVLLRSGWSALRVKEEFRTRSAQRWPPLRCGRWRAPSPRGPALVPARIFLVKMVRERVDTHGVRQYAALCVCVRVRARSSERQGHGKPSA